ncbi:ComEC/Rec2 family competence protein [Aliiroseovarius subalbicans]|uniref:ComEC/Rec2 family competence protein n=1 Tax=Aliiroseovarius subalbicans TaxID=2925840 RepID=UPI001F5A0F54|nr:ComEC/Rec2 family competence protein [Aliiroseovarius subalbicans]MCI2398780.1 ComEC family competence protein [Aliiroseovarius subalbicans]
MNRVAASRGRLFPWTPVFLATGIGVYFLLPVEPGFNAYVTLGLITVLALLLAWRFWRTLGPVFVALALVTGGVLLAGAKAGTLSAPVLSFRYHGPVEGRIVIIDRSQSDAVRLTLDQVRLDNVAPHETPARVRVSLHGQQGYFTPEPGLRVAMTAHLSAPQGPVEPGGFDFQRMAWFRQIGAVGYTRVPALALAPAHQGRAGLVVHRLRMRISNWVQSHMEGEPGAFAAAIMTGDRSGMSQQTLTALRGSNLAHLLAISGLHMGLLTGFVFAAIRALLALIPSVALRFPVKKVAAVVALAAGAFYLALSGGNVATERAFIMVATMFVALLFDRRALTLRSVALAALIVLVLHPQAFPEPGFQMSFSATTALVAVFGVMRDWTGWQAPRWTRPILAVVVSSAVAGAATAPFAAAHFNQVSYYGLVANLLSVPLMGALVMPLAVLAAVLAPLGLAGLALWAMGPAISWILGVAAHVSSMDGALGHVATPPVTVLPMIALGGLVVILWRGWGRALGLAPVALALVLWSQVTRPDLLVSSSGGLIGVMTDAGRAVNKPRGEGFAVRSWLENDGDPVPQADAFARGAFRGDKGDLRFDLGPTTVAHLTGRGASERVQAACATGAWVILSAEVEDLPEGCNIWDRKALSQTGPLAVYAEPHGWRVVETRTQSGDRLWNRGAEAQ